MKKEINEEYLKELANKLMFDLSEKETKTLKKEFEMLMKQMNDIKNVDNIKNVEPMIYPFIEDSYELRSDSVDESLSIEEIFLNAKEKDGNELKVPKVVE